MGSRRLFRAINSKVHIGIDTWNVIFDLLYLG